MPRQRVKPERKRRATRRGGQRDKAKIQHEIAILRATIKLLRERIRGLKAK